MELADNYDGTESCLDSRPADFERDVHGTAVASIIAGLNNNGECANGIAPGATISSCVGPLRLTDASNLLLSRLDKGKSRLQLSGVLFFLGYDDGNCGLCAITNPYNTFTPCVS